MKYFKILAIVLVSFIIGWFSKDLFKNKTSSLPNVIEKIKPRPLDKYTIENLSRRTPSAGPIVLGEIIADNKDYTSYSFSFTTEKKTVTGQLNLPKSESKRSFPVIVMIRGYVDQKIYQTGIGTQKAAGVFAKNGYITIAPDFLGYGGSDKESSDVFESRFQTYTTMQDLLESIKSYNSWDKKNLFIWAHSNGGQIALTTLEITGREIPTTLWAPVSKPFPFNVLAYTDEATDSGKFLRSKLAEFEETYDTDLYSLSKYLDRIKATVQIQQGTADDAVPYWWSQDLNKSLKKDNVDVTLIIHPGANHNMTPVWDGVVNQDLVFFQKHLVK